MTQSITNWYTAGGKLREVQLKCEVLDLYGEAGFKQVPVEEAQEICETLIAIVDFCVASLKNRSVDTSSALPSRDHETYLYARKFAKVMARALLRHDEVPIEVKERMEEWLDREPDFPSIHILYV